MGEYGEDVTTTLPPIKNVPAGQLTTDELFPHTEGPYTVTTDLMAPVHSMFVTRSFRLSIFPTRIFHPLEMSGFPAVRLRILVGSDQL